MNYEPWFLEKSVLFTYLSIILFKISCWIRILLEKGDKYT